MTPLLRSGAFDDAAEIPRVHICQGDDTSPPLNWSGVPWDSRSLVLIVDGPDTQNPKAPKMTWLHWVLFNIPPDGTGEGLNDRQRSGSGGPCPPVRRHRHFQKRAFLRLPADDYFASTTAGRQIRKPPFDRISKPATTYQSIAAVATSDLERQLRPRTVSWLSGSSRSTAVVRVAATKGRRPADVSDQPVRQAAASGAGRRRKAAAPRRGEATGRS
jgi:hypothetical protein